MYKQMKSVSIFSSILVLFLLLQIGIVTAQESTVIRVFVSEKVEIINARKYYLHTVEKGQTLYSIAVAYNRPLGAIAKENNIENNLISIGQVLRIPVDVDPSEYSNTANVSKNDTLFHEVKKGETLFGISKKYNVTVAELEKMNPVLKNGLKMGQKIIVSLNAIKPVSVQSKTSDDVPDSSDKYIIHIVQKKRNHI